MVLVDTAAGEQNTTETAKTYKVTCDKRNITGLENFTVQVLNASQVPVLPSELFVENMHPSTYVILEISQVSNNTVLDKPLRK